MGGRPVDADVVVVGGGPAGAAAAISCAMRGLGVVLCERERPGRERPGELLHPGIEPLLGQLGIAGQLAPVVGARPAGIWIEWGAPRRFEAFGADATGPWSGLQVRRAKFDALLLRGAREVGVDVRQPCAVTGARFGDGTPGVVQTAAGPIAARIVVDASGAARWLGRALGLASPARSPRLVARYGYAEGSCPARDEAPSLVGDASGWTWTALVRPKVYQWIRVSFWGEPNPGAVPEELCHLRPIGRPRGADVTWRLATELAGPGWFTVGDAAAVLDPTSSHGVLKAVISGLTAGHLIAAVLRERAPPEATATAYHEWLSGWFCADARRLREFYRGLGAAAFAPRPCTTREA